MKKQILLYTIILVALIVFQNKSILQTDDSDIFIIRSFISNANYYPLDKSKDLLYKSNFGDLKLSIEKKGEIYITEMKFDDLIYRQNLVVKGDGIYVEETYQKIKLLLFVNKESKFTYSEPLPRFKYPLTQGQTWEWSGTEFNDDEKNSLEVKSAIIGIEQVKISAGDFDAMKVITEIKSSSGTKNKVTEWLAKDIGIIKSEIEINGGGLMGFVRDLLGYGKLSFELLETKNK